MTLSLRNTRHEIVSQAHEAHNRDVIVSADTIDLVSEAMSGVPGLTYDAQKHRFRVVREALKPFTDSDEVRAIRKLAKKAIKEIDRRVDENPQPLSKGGELPYSGSPDDEQQEQYEEDVEEVPLPESLMSYFNSLTAEPPVHSLTVSFGDGTPHAFYTLEEAKRILSENG